MIDLDVDPSLSASGSRAFEVAGDGDPAAPSVGEPKLGSFQTSLESWDLSGGSELQYPNEKTMETKMERKTETMESLYKDVAATDPTNDAHLAEILNPMPLFDP